MDPETLQALGLGPQDTTPPSTDFASLLGYVPPSAPPASPPPPQVGGPVVDPSQTSPDDAAQVPTPDQLPHPSLTPITNAQFGLKAGMSAGTSVSGYSQAANTAIHQGPGTALDKKLAGDQAQATQRYSPIIDEQQRAAHEEIEGARQTSDVLSQQALVKGELHTRLAAANQDFAAKEQGAIEKSQAEAASSMASYRLALADYAASKVNPSDLWDHAGAAGQVGMMATAFAHDFLGARGIKTSGLDTINQAIKNNIDAQLANIAAKKNVTEGFKALWEMQRQQSSSDAEARKRMHGFYLSSIGDEIEAKLSSYDSKLALAQGQTAKAKILEAQAKNNLEVQKDIDTAANARATNDVHAYSAELSASSARYAANAHIEAAKIAAGKKDSPLANLFIDTSKSGDNTAIRRFLPGVTPDAQRKIQENYDNTATTASQIQDLVEIQQKLGAAIPTGNVGLINKLQGEGQRAAEQLRTIVRTNLLYDSSGKAINEQEMKNFDNMVSKNDWWTNGDNTRNLAILAKSKLDRIKANVSGSSYEIPEGDPAHGLKTGHNKAAPAESTIFDIESQPGSGKPEESQTDKLAKWASSPNALEAYDLKKLPKDGPGNQSSVAADWAKARKEGLVNLDQYLKEGEDGKLGGEILNTRTPKVGLLGNHDEAHVAGTNPNNPDRAFVQLERLADLAIGGDKKAESLIHELADKGGDSQLGATLKAYAQWEESQISDRRNGKLPSWESRKTSEE